MTMSALEEFPGAARCNNTLVVSIVFTTASAKSSFMIMRTAACQFSRQCIQSVYAATRQVVGW